MLPSPLLGRTGAVAGPGGDPDSAVPAHYGDPLREQVALAAGRALSALARDVVIVTGPDRLSWLTTLSSQVLTDLAPGDGGAEALLMDAHGRIAHALAALDDGQRLLLVTEAGFGEDLAGFLESMRFMLRVEVRAAEELAVLGAMGDGVARLEEAARPEHWLGTWRDPWPGVVEGGTSYDVGLEGRPHPGAGYRAGWVVVPAGDVPEVVRAYERGLDRDAAGEAAGQGGSISGAQGGEHAVAGSALAGSMAWEALRVEAGRPRQAREADARAIPHELDWLRTAVHLTKGCYPGQETVARTVNLGRPPRRLTVLQLDGLGGELPAPGAAVRLGERTVGAVTSVARHHELGPMALALLRRGVPLGEPLTVAVTEADQDIGREETGHGGQDGRDSGTGSQELREVGRVAAAQEPLVSPQGRAQASPAERPGAGLRSAGTRGTGQG
ncbi:folate-binding protein [Actinomyces lilanjuaniae]|uniref:Folate-binding protein n=1 Tax=Actinomyces lilanjuaniae TaxID=2321394 RepID=A0ABM6Z1W9_9ACTO|nr:folate-binding protein [Actinomyces lilanjuaniae]AYD89197.1 folate-binding protein [Actinomyces lilanjuaniae]